MAAPGAGEAGETASDITHLAHRLAVEHAQCGQRRASKRHLRLLAQLPMLASELRAAYQAVLHAAAADMALSYAAEWLLDNFYVVEQALHLIQDDLPETFYRQLPILGGDGPTSDQPRVYALAHTFVAHEQCEVETSQLQRFILVYQQTQPLTMGELWALPLMVRLSLLEQLAQGVRDLVHPETAGNMSQATVPGESSIVAAAIPSLRRLDSVDWQACFETISLVEQVLRQDPAQAYAAMDFTTRDRYRKAIEELAAGSTRSELVIAQHTIALAQRHRVSSAPDPTGPAPAGDVRSAPQLFGTRRYHVGYYLLGHGRSQLEREIDYHARGTRRWRRWVLRHCTFVYVGGITLGTVLLLALVVAYTARALPAEDNLLLWAGGAVLLSLVPLLTVAVTAVNWLLTHTLPPRVLPKLEFTDGIPSTCSTMVVIPCLISNTSDLDILFNQLELHYLRNPDPALAFALLSDFTDAATPTRPEDEPLLAYAQEKLTSAARQAYAATILLFPSSAPVEPERARLDGLGAQTWQAPRAQSVAAWR